MSGLKGLAQGGWHPKGKDGKTKESWRGDFKGVNQVAGWMGKGKGSSSQETSDHIARPITSLKDPAAFGPPPKNVNFHGGAALPNQTTPDTRGLGAPISRDNLRAKQKAEEEEAQREAEEAARPKPPPVPFRIDTTGLSTSNLPPPPGRKDGADGRHPSPSSKPKPPGLPPRLPPRQNSNPTSFAPSPPPTYQTATEPESHKGILNGAALNRLGAAGVSVQGLGIGASKGRAPLPPPAPLSPSQTQSNDSITASNSQLSELQSRFSRFSPSPSPKTGGTSEGTTFAQKQAALKTASSFRDNPSSVSLSDARTAASTANNFRERHGEQVKTGWQSANKLNSKYGIAEKVGSYGGVGKQTPEADPSAGTDGHSSTEAATEPTVFKKKPPPPPPIKKAQLAGSSVLKDSIPPPIPLASKPKPPPTSSHDTEDLDLDLKSLWFTTSPPSFPPKTVNRQRISYASSSGWSSVGARKTHTFSAIVQHNTTMARTKIQITWDGSNPGVTVKAQQKHYPPPRRLNSHELEASKEKYSEALANWSESKMGQKVGNGECWTLAHDGLQAVGAQCSSQGQEPCMASQSLIHGHLIYSFVPAVSPYPEPRGGVREAGVARGDVIQLLTAHFHGKDGSQKWAGAPDHTSVITRVEADGVLRVVEQNVGNVKKVQEGSYDMSELVKGEVRIFRAVGVNWAGELDPTW